MNLSMHKPIRATDMFVPHRGISQQIKTTGGLGPCFECDKKSHCQKNRHACRAYAAYATCSSEYKAALIWKDKPQEPSRYFFDYINSDRKGRLRGVKNGG
ncbi:MAG: hypothetical protein COB36_10945 [Alphaproteobacteria bacterium]|nr:MAG: hypothetical protein COB36_10945 [Alphaproteobacteria bacterium]